ncbi:Elongator complex protein 5 [Komagataella phaffii CBS 7435]|uniref:Elongator complex protein 5 n=2 Tax=Komagataella phaffii TaxID=460519 RepID=C4R893_KOMPG|nr:Subunit of Elongator complex, which is required for modification of wobble nucleosides in tRNA [Komagataella phaffii GS115]AOA64916.1 GQ67_04928T0 [Komagataella phaffii]CAH2450789.1 Elongator complex protein 5 [Komagataella phaffii CBS 7435]AOA69560.1 GQ68_04900T0 [Komagataella phaffii GS115]CAY71818.1 Subunit of Elongator complex, which is required for modification of wobble nucleosides in tRNA [Komagataella phaffii GS115]CCA40583.1 Elongator complex protein 5 [Komagataella phaffii CBS 743
MAQSQPSLVLLNRLLSLKEPSHFLLCIDSLFQSSFHFTRELVRCLPKETPIIYLSFETINAPSFATDFLRCDQRSIQDISNNVSKLHKDSTSKKLVLIDSLNFIKNEELASFIRSIADPQTIVFGTYHQNIPRTSPAQSELKDIPPALSLLQFIASSIFEISPINVVENGINKEGTIEEEVMESYLSKLYLPRNICNRDTYKLILTNRRKSGRALIYKFKIDSQSHTFSVFTEEKDTDEQQPQTEADLLRSLTTFSLTTSSRQQQAKEQVDLPFLEAQSFGAGGAIVYEYEKDDDYDEDDPYEDPF